MRNDWKKTRYTGERDEERAAREREECKGEGEGGKRITHSNDLFKSKAAKPLAIN